MNLEEVRYVPSTPTLNYVIDPSSAPLRSKQVLEILWFTN